MKTVILCSNFALAVFMAWAITASYHTQNPVIKVKTELKTFTVYKPIKAEPTVIVKYVKEKAKRSYWEVLAHIESRGGKRKYQKASHRGCKTTPKPCGKYQIDRVALKDIGWKGTLADRDNDALAFEMAKQIKAKKLARFKVEEDYLAYLLHQQGASGLKWILDASKGKHLFTRKQRAAMARNSPWSSAHLKRIGDKNAAKKFLRHWKDKWNKYASL